MTSATTRRWWWVRRVGMIGAALVLIEYLAVPQLVRATSDLTILTDAAPALLVLGLLLEVCSVASYTALTRAVVPAAVRPAYVDQLRIDVTGLGFSHVVPGGGASAAALRFRLMTGRGVPAIDAAAAAAVQTAVAVIGLVATFACGVVLAGPRVLTHPGYAASGAAAGLVLLAVVLGTRSMGRHPARVLPATAAGAAPSSTPGTCGRARDWVAESSAAAIRSVAATARRTRVVVADPRRRVVVLGWAAGNWLFDAASLWACLAAYRVEVDPAALLMAYGAANLLGLLPLTPGGLGVVEGVLVPSLVALGGAAVAPVTLGVLTWRLFEFWLPIPVAGITYLTLRWPRRVTPHAGDTSTGRGERRRPAARRTRRAPSTRLRRTERPTRDSGRRRPPA